VKLTPPEKSIKDDIQALTKGAISCIPGVGGVAAELFSMVVSPALDRRRQEWMTQVAQELTNLNNKIDASSWEALQQDEQFIDILLHATQIALRTHQSEKHVALRNAVCNTALNININYVQKTMFLRFVDELTVLHMKVLDILNDPREWEKKNKYIFLQEPQGGILYMVEQAIPEVFGLRELLTLTIKDLQVRGLLMEFPVNSSTMSWDDIMFERETGMGCAFRMFISKPIDNCP